MTIKHSLPDDSTPADAPPSYEPLGAGSSNQDYGSEKPPVVGQMAGPSRLSLHSPLLSPTPLPLKSQSLSSSSSAGPSPTNNKGKGRASNSGWFTLTQSPQARTRREVRTTVLGLVRDLIQEHNSPVTIHTGILQSCTDACASNSLSFSSLLQEKSIESHTSLYWTIVKRLPDEHHEVEAQQGPDLLSAIISFASPLKQETISDIWLACITMSDQALFQRLRLSPEFAFISGVDRLLFGITIPPEDIEVEYLPGDGGAFAANVVIPHFYKRMVVRKSIAVQFIARNRMWQLAFFIAPGFKAYGIDPAAGSWCISLSLLETSPPTFIDSKFLIPEATPPETPKSPVRPEPPSSPCGGVDHVPSNTSEDKPPLWLRLQSRDCQLQAGRVDIPGMSAVLASEYHLSGANIQFGNGKYIQPDEKLRGRLEARLLSERPRLNTDCIIC
ncbi:hypothetical protein BDZ97DRAFT_2076051 [Flammula alnicola]|nr:hypothetical protein BDZ97DRAFT_2076051 [Flammula alnicola]